MATKKVYLHHGDVVRFCFVPDDYNTTATDFKEAYVRPELFSWDASVTNTGIHIFDPDKYVKKSNKEMTIK